MDMTDCLARTRASVEDDPVAVVSYALRNRHFMRVGNEVGQQPCFGGCEFGQIRVMLARDHKDVNGCLWVDIAERHSPRISRDYGRGYLSGCYAAEQTVGHGPILTCTGSAALNTYMVTLREPTVHHPSGATASPVSGSVAQG
jgi:hypothetical protein